jgi:hypothetical protein
MGDSPTPNQDPALSAKVTTGGLSAPASRWKARCHLLWIDGSQPPVHAPLLGIDVEELPGSHGGRKTKDHFPPRQWSSFLCFTFLSGPMTKVIIWGKSGQPLELYFTWPLACSLRDLLFCHSLLIVPETPVTLLGWDLLSQLKAQILLPPGSYLCCPLLQEQIDPTVWNDEMSEPGWPSLFK